MKKVFGVIGVLILLVVVGTVLLKTIDINRIGKSNLYVEVIEPTEVKEDKLNSGEIVKSYWYEQKAFDTKGNEIDVEFFALKELRKGAYLKLYVGKDNEVSSYDEVKWGDIPSDTQAKLEEKGTKSQED
jgi:uncharacterized protein (TIGR01655 family)